MARNEGPTKVSVGYVVSSINNQPLSVLLAIRQKGFGWGRYTPYRGEVGWNESWEECMRRGLREESGLVCLPEDIEPVGSMEVTYRSRGDGGAEVESVLDIQLHLIHDWAGAPKSTVRMRHPEFFPLRHLPYDKMLGSDAKILKRILMRKTVSARAIYDLPTLTLREFSIADLITRFPRAR